MRRILQVTLYCVLAARPSALRAPLRWVDVHPLMRVAFASPAVAAKLRLSGTRNAVRSAVPLIH